MLNSVTLFRSYIEGDAELADSDDEQCPRLPSTVATSDFEK